MIQVQKTKAGIKLIVGGEKISIGNSSLDVTTEKSAWKNIHSNRPSRIREFDVKKFDAELDIDLDLVSNIIEEEPMMSLEDALKRTDACSFNQSMNHNWGSKAVAGLLNYIYEIDIFTHKKL